MQPRAKSRVFELAYIHSHSLSVPFHLFLPQICHSDCALLHPKNHPSTVRLIDDSTFIRRRLCTKRVNNWNPWCSVVGRQVRGVPARTWPRLRVSDIFGMVPALQRTSKQMLAPPFARLCSALVTVKSAGEPMVTKSLDEKVWKVQQSSRTLPSLCFSMAFGSASNGPEWTGEASQILYCAFGASLWVDIFRENRS